MLLFAAPIHCHEVHKEHAGKEMNDSLTQRFMGVVSMVGEERILAERDVSSWFAARGETMEIENKKCWWMARVC